MIHTRYNVWDGEELVGAALEKRYAMLLIEEIFRKAKEENVGGKVVQVTECKVNEES